MSGGIDSFVTALLLQQRGYEVIGVSLQLWEKNDLAAVERICRSLNIPLICREEEKLFRQQVVEVFVRDYLSGFTPSPCCLCNSVVKWEALDGVAREYGASSIATGHYVRIKPWGEKYYIRQGVDARKDQSYFLWGVSQEILSKAITPLGDYTKEEVKAWALAQGYEEMVRKKESMGICFLRGKDYRDFIRQYGDTVQKPGLILNKSGQLVGEHQGLLNYTIGQKRGMPLFRGEQLYVAEMDAEHNVIIADRKSGLYTSAFMVDDLVVVDPQDLRAEDIHIKVRGLGLNPQGTVKIERLTEKKGRVELSDPAWAVAPGQPVAFFRGDCVIGGGKVTREEKINE